MHPLWMKLEDLATNLRAKFDEHFSKYDNPKYDDGLKFPGWRDDFWTSPLVRKAHIKTIVPENGRGLWLMHVNVFPHEGIELPILGFDIVAGPKKITGSFMDFSPLHGHPHPYHDYMEQVVKDLTWHKQRELPPWAQEIFSENMIAVGQLRYDDELQQFIEVTTDLTDYYLDNLIKNAFRSNRDTKPILNKYCINQKMNPHLHRSIEAMGISKEDKNRYVNDVLFEEI